MQRRQDGEFTRVRSQSSAGALHAAASRASHRALELVRSRGVDEPGLDAIGCIAVAVDPGTEDGHIERGLAGCEIEVELPSHASEIDRLVVAERAVRIEDASTPDV